MQRAEIISIGTELLLGQVLDTNSQFMSSELAHLGINCFYHSTVGDNESRIRDCLRKALGRANLIFTSGGLGPTADDLTIKCIADLFGVDMVQDDAVLKRLREFFKLRGVEMPLQNEKQALRPRGSEILPNPVGTAPGIIWRIDRELLSSIGVELNEEELGCERTIITFPGVPSELKVMWRETVSPYLAGKFEGSTIFSVELKHFGIGESSLAEKFDYLLSGSNPTVAPYSGRGECRLRVTAKAATLEEAKSLAEPLVEEIRNKSGSDLYGYDDDTLESVVAKTLMSKGLTLSTAESCTGGLLSKRLTDIPGCSAYTSLNLITYSNEAKSKMLGVSEDILVAHGAVSPECAQAMAEGVRSLSGSDIGVGITGIAGPTGGDEEKPIGLVFIGVSTAGGYRGKRLNLGSHSSRTEIRYRTASEALNMIRLHLLEVIADCHEPTAC